jgi:hypothetical protein
MKSSLKFTTLALLLGSILNITCLDAATVTVADASSLASRITLEEAIENPTQRSAFFRQDFSDDKGDVVFQLAETGESVPAKQKRSFARDAIGSGWLPEEAIRSRVTGTMGLKKSLLEGWVNVASGLALARASNPDLFAFSTLSAPSVGVPVSTGWTTYLAVNPADSSLPIAEQLYLLNVREKLASLAGLPASLTRLDELLVEVQKMAIDDRTQVARASFLVNAIPQVRGIAPVIGDYLQSILRQITEINKAATRPVAGGWLTPASSVTAPDALQTLQLKELRARENLAYAVFDAIFGRMVKPASVDASVSFLIDPSPANILVSKVHALHAILPATQASEKLVVKNDGSIAATSSGDFTTGIDLHLAFMAEACTATTTFKAMALGAMDLVKETFRSTALKGFADLSIAKASLTSSVIEVTE